MPASYAYRVGFEFQDSSNAASQNGEPWVTYSKVPIFTVFSKNEQNPEANNIKLWHLEVDYKDIEFVTPPFVISSGGEGDYKDQTGIALQALQSIKKAAGLIWTYCKNIEELVNELIKFYLIEVSNEKYENELIFYDQVKNLPFNKAGVRKWCVPQATIQFPIQDTLSLCMGLFTPQVGQTLPTSLKGVRDIFVDVFPEYKELSAEECVKLYEKESVGFYILFWQMLSLLMACTEVRNVVGDLMGSLKGDQLGVKKYTSIMHRRPYSQLFKKINKDSQIFFKETNSAQLLVKKVQKAGDIIEEYKKIGYISKNFKKLNYGWYTSEGIVSDNTKKTLKNAVSLKDDIRKSYKIDKNYVKDEDFNKIIDTAMFISFIRFGFGAKVVSFSPDEMTVTSYMEQKWFEDLLDSVENPKPNFTGSFNVEGDQNSSVSFCIDPSVVWAHYDLASPFSFLDEPGTYKQDEKNENFYKDDIYGSAIMEFRGIKDALSYAGGFLCSYNSFEKEAEALFDFLKSLQGENKNDIKKQIYQSFKDYISQNI